MFVQIGDENAHLVRNVLDEVFGSENFCVQIDFVKTAGQTSRLPADVTDHILWYARSKEFVKTRPLFTDSDVSRLIQTTYGHLESPNGEMRQLTAEEKNRRIAIPHGTKLISLSDLTSQTGGVSSQQSFEYEEMSFTPKGGRGWRTSMAGLQMLVKAKRLHIKGENVFYKQFLDDFPVDRLSNLWPDTQLGGFLRSEEKVYVVQTIMLAIQRCLLMTTDPGDLVLDPTCGSGTTAAVAEQWGRRWITCDTSRVAIALARTRLMSSRFPYYLLADSQEGAEKEAGIRGRAEAASGKFSGDVHKGFVYKRVPHVTLKSIANNPDIKDGMSRVEIDAAIARHAESETLYDQPYEDPKRVRVTGPFSVESLSPHRVLTTEQDKPTTNGADRAGGDFVTMILDNLKKAGLQNTIKKERLKFESLESFSGVHIQAVGTFLEGEKEKRAAVCIGPEHGTVGPDLVKEAAK